MAILKIKDKDGNVIDIPAIQGDNGTTYIFTDIEQNEVLNKTFDSMRQAEEMLL